MGWDRDIQRSLMYHVRGLFLDPPSGSGLAAYTVYNETDLRDKALSIFRPCVFLTSDYVRPAPPKLPLIVVECETHLLPFELGNTAGTLTNCGVNVFGRMKAERDDLAGMIARNLKPGIAIYGYTTSGSSLVEYAVVGDVIDIEQVDLRRDALRQESSLDLWATVSFSLQTKQ